jgi:hypothetical protein
VPEDLLSVEKILSIDSTDLKDVLVTDFLERGHTNTIFNVWTMACNDLSNGRKKGGPSIMFISTPSLRNLTVFSIAY